MDIRDEEKMHRALNVDGEVEGDEEMHLQITPLFVTSSVAKRMTGYARFAAG